MPQHSVVDYCGEQNNYRCGYCKTIDSNQSHGMWAHALTAEDYQVLINRGWRRSGQYCYKPIMDRTCCPAYTIRCDALNFRLTKSHKKIIKRVNKFLKDGLKEKHEQQGEEHGSEADGGHGDFQEMPKEGAKPAELQLDEIVPSQVDCDEVDAPPQPPPAPEVPSTSSVGVEERKEGPDPSRPLCKKAKLMRLERKREKLAQKGLPMPEKATKNVEKSLEDFLGEAPTDDGVHKLKLQLVPATRGVTEEVVALYRKYQVSVHRDPPSKITRASFERFLVKTPLKIQLLATKDVAFKTSVRTEYELYRKYQTKVHNDPPSNVDEFLDFLVNTPMKVSHSPGAPSCGYGSFHQQYWLDSRLIAVAVIDILPQCVSSVYFFYDPEFSFLSLGTYASLRELALTRQLHATCPSLSSYYMGFYIHSCPKMRYKGRLHPSYLACPETYTWHALDEKLTAKLDRHKYQRLNEDPAAVDADRFSPDDLPAVLVLVQMQYMPYGRYSELTGGAGDADVVIEYSRLVGRTCAQRMLLVRT